MAFLKYYNETKSNIIPKEEFEELVQDVFGIISENISKSLGPLGSSATIIDGSLTEATKDGYAIFKNYRFRNKYKRMIYNLIKAPCTALNNTVGDATTTVIVFTNALFARYQEHKNALELLYRLPRTFTKAWDEVIHELSDRVQKMSAPIDSSDYDTIYNLAYVSSNGNHEISDNIAKTYQQAHTPSIRLKDSPTNKSYINPISGFEFPANLIHVCYARNQDGSAEERDFAVMIFDHKIETDYFNNVIVKINDVMRARGHKLVIIAPYYDQLLCETVLEQYVNFEYQQYHALNLILTQYAPGKLEENQLMDLSVVLGNKPITQDLAMKLANKVAEENTDKVVEDILEKNQYELYRFISICEKALLSYTTGSNYQNDHIKKEQRYIDTLESVKYQLEKVKGQTDYEKQSYAAKLYELKARIMRLEMNNFIYYIGADSTLQKNIIWDAVDDVVKCIKSAIKYGVVPGCQLSIIRACDDMLVDILGDNLSDEAMTKAIEEATNEDKLKVEILYIILTAVGDVYSRVLHGPDGMGLVKTMEGWQFTDTEAGVEKLHKKTWAKSDEIIAESIKRNQVFDIDTLEYNPNIKTSAETDRMVLAAASDIVKILISGNQCIIVDPETDSCEDTDVQI